LVVNYKQELREYCSRRDELHLAEKLFDIPLTSYPQLQMMSSSLDRLQLIYQLFYEQQRTMHDWSQMLWSEVNVEMLSTGVDQFEYSHRKLPADLKNLPPYNFMKKALETFKESIPLFMDLKNEALRDRHWNEMMSKTGAGIDFQPNAVTLANIFKMNLLQFSDVIAEVTNTASKELSIEKGHQEFSDT
jgi:dynein heavy chain